MSNKNGSDDNGKPPINNATYSKKAKKSNLNPIVKRLLKTDPSFLTEENVIHAKKAFMINSVVKWILEKQDKKVADLKQYKACIVILERFIKDEVSLAWKGNELLIKELKKKE